ncbi:hypothetical protein BX600DRAFT_512251 [Xylariales sp. PMI_506]|nr:hypothetical protein BX600DRAFT_512251 [Xylariales sp. PMI_506]
MPKGIGIFSKQAGIDGASIWAGATSGDGAIQVHLLACMLARMWSGPEATSIWAELLECRRVEIQKKFDENRSVDIGTMIAVQHQLDRSLLAEWDASARAWLRIADSSKRVQQKRLLHIIGDFSRRVNSKPVLFESVINAWKAGLEGMEALLQGSPMVIQSGDVIPALCSWHLYPDLNILCSTSKVSQNDKLVPQSGILTINFESTTVPRDKGLRWSLPLAHLRYYEDVFLSSSSREGEYELVQSQEDGQNSDVPRATIKPANPVQDQNIIFSRQREIYTRLGDDVMTVEGDHIFTLSPLGKPMRIIWGYLGLSPASHWEAYDPWFGEMKHYGYWLGDPDSVAIFIRMDQAKPEGQTQISFSDLQDIFEPEAFNIEALPLIFADALGYLERTYLQSLRAFSTMYELYQNLKQATIDVRVFEHPLSRAKWFQYLFDKQRENEPADEPDVEESEDEREEDGEDFGEFRDKFICDGSPPPVETEITMFAVPKTSSEDTASPSRRAKVQHVMGNVGRPGTALLIPPLAPRTISKSIKRWPLIHLQSWDGLPRDSFQDSSLHLLFTGSTQEVDIGYSGAQDKELYILESVVSLHGMGEWIADLDILKALQNPPYVYRHRQKRIPRGPTGRKPSTATKCAEGHDIDYVYENLPLAAIENWAELLEDTNKDRTFLAAKNWQARLAAAMICVSQQKRVCLLTNSICWTCVVLSRKSQSELSSPTVYI